MTTTKHSPRAYTFLTSVCAGSAVLGMVLSIGLTDAQLSSYEASTMAAHTNTVPIKPLPVVPEETQMGSIINGSDVSDGTSINAGINDIGAFTVSAIPYKGGDGAVMITDMIFTVNANGIALDSTGFRLYNKNNPTLSALCTPLDTQGQVIPTPAIGLLYIECRDLPTSGVNMIIGQINPETFVIRATVIGPVSVPGDKSLMVSLDHINRSRQNPATTFGVTESHVAWMSTNPQGPRHMGIVDGEETVVSTIYRE